MKKTAKFYVGLGLAGILFWPLVGVCREADWQLWLDQSLGYDVSENYTLRADQSFRMKQGESGVDTYSLMLGVRMHRSSWIEHGGYLRYVRENKLNTSHDEFRPTYDLSLKWAWGKTRWVNRSRFEYRIREGRDDLVRYRTRQKLILPGRVFGLKPYGAAELFFNLYQDDPWEKNRFRGLIGIQTEPDGFIRKIEFKAGRRIKADYYLMYQQTESLGFVVDEYVLGFKLGYFF